jgi:membrane protease YdiL (CAAX protease family)
MNQLIKRYPVLTFFVLTTVLGWLAVIVGTALMPIDAEHPMTPLHGILVFFIASPSVVGILLTAIIDGREGLRELFDRAKRWRVHPKWYAAALLLFFALSGLSYVVQGLLGGPLAPINFVEQLAFFIPISLMACLLEEFGWRGFALPRLQRRYNALVSALIVGLGWALWHLAINYLGLSGQYGGSLLFLLLLISTQFNFADSVLLSWIHNNAQSSMLLMILGHFSITMGNMFGLSNPTIQDFIRANLVSVAIRWLAAIVIIVRTGPKRLVREPR